MSDSFAALDAIAQAELIGRDEATPTELVDAAIQRIERLDSQLGAVIAQAFDRAHREAQALTGKRRDPSAPFCGVPFLLKDLGGQQAAAPYHMGIRALKEAGYKETVDSHFVTRLRRAGFVILGRTNTPELGLLPTTEPLAYGPTRNPWNLAYSPGGSSGGAAAAVAAGLVPVAHASDGGGSIRIPAAHCGLVGLKPTRGRSSFGPLAGERWSGFSCELVVSRTVRDTAALLDVVAGPAPGDPYFAAPPHPSFSTAMARPPKQLRIGLLVESPNPDIALHPDCTAAAQRTARVLSDLGHTVELASPPCFGEPDRVRTFVTIVSCNVARTLEVVAEKLGRTLEPGDVEPLTWTLAEMGRACSTTQYLAALDYTHAFGRRMAAWWEDGFDLLLTPTTGEPPPVLGSFPSTDSAPLEGFIRSAPFALFTSAFNMTGQPAISLPMHSTADGLPLGAQLVARYGGEDLLLAIAAQLEQAHPWKQRRPSIFAGD